MGPDMASQPPQRSARPGAAVTRLDHALLDGPDMAPQTPQRSARPGAAVTRLDHALLDGPRHGPPNPQTFEVARHSRAASLSARTSVEHGGPDMAPKPPNVRSGPA